MFVVRPNKVRYVDQTSASNSALCSILAATARDAADAKRAAGEAAAVAKETLELLRHHDSADEAVAVAKETLRLLKHHDHKEPLYEDAAIYDHVEPIYEDAEPIYATARGV